MSPGSDDSGPAAREAYRELIDELGALGERLADSPRAETDPQFLTESYRWIFSITQVALDCYLWGDRDNPRFVDIVGPYKKWGGDNSDAFYQFAPVDPTRSYRVRGRRGDAVYVSLTVYGGPDDGRYSERIVAACNDRDLTFAADGSFEIWLSAQPPEDPGATWVRLEPDAVCAVTRDYLARPDTEARTAWRIEAVDPPATWRGTNRRTADGLRAALTWVRDQAAMVPTDLAPTNALDDPYPVPSKTHGWAAGDAAYAMGTYHLADDEVLVLRGRSPSCAFWNLCLWNPYLHTYNYDYERVTINGEQVVHENDGSWTIEVSPTPTGHPNHVSTQGHHSGRLWFRWFLPADTPDPVAIDVRRH